MHIWTDGIHLFKNSKTINAKNLIGSSNYFPRIAKKKKFAYLKTVETKN